QGILKASLNFRVSSVKQNLVDAIKRRPRKTNEKVRVYTGPGTKQKAHGLCQNFTGVRALTSGGVPCGTSKRGRAKATSWLPKPSRILMDTEAARWRGVQAYLVVRRNDSTPQPTKVGAKDDSVWD
ncbi:MAG: hypothetical protein ABSC55_03110, partial [Syntrophorhabdales bacterium]